MHDNGNGIGDAGASEGRVALVGDGPAAAAVRAAVDDWGATVVDVDVGGEGGGADEGDGRDGEAGSGVVIGDLDPPVDLAVVVGPAGDGRFEGVPGRWLAVETGGVGGHPLSGVDAAVSVLGGDGPTFADLRARVASTVDVPAATPEADPASVRLAGAVAGRRAVAALVGDDVGGTVVEVSGVDVGGARTLLPVPEPNPDRVPPLSSREASLDDALARMERALDDRVGPIVEVGERESFPVPYYVAATADTTAYGDARAAEYAAGVDAGWDAAFAKALGEGLERYSAGVYRTAAFTTAPTRTRARPVDPDRFVRPSGEGWATPAVDDPLPWVEGVDLARYLASASGAGSDGDAADDSGREPPREARVSLPAELVVYPPPTERLRPAITTGLGLGNSGVEALVAGLTEAIERDATMLAWYSTYEPLELAVDDPGYDTLVGRARAEDLTATALLVTADVDVPVVAATVHRAGDWPRFAAGSAADLDPTAAARSALAEAIQNWTELRAMGPEAATGEGGAIGRYADFPEAARAFVDAPTTVPAADVGPDEVPTGVDELRALVDRVGDAGLDAYVSRLTPRDVASLGFEAVRVLVPAAQPLFVGDPYFGERARTVPGELGFEPRLDRAYHPFP